MALLREGLDGARRGAGRMVEVVGEPGIGKSRLIEELHASHEARVLFAAAEAFTSSSPYIIWRALLRELLGVPWEAEDETVMARLRDAGDGGRPVAGAVDAVARDPSRCRHADDA